MATPSAADQLHDWSQLNTHLKALLKEAPHLADVQAELEELLTESRRLETQRARYTARLRQVNKRRAQLWARGQEVKGRIADGLRHLFGTKSLALLQYGVRPRAGGPKPKRRKTPAEPETAPEPAPETAT
jgi:hypothetical protein